MNTPHAADASRPMPSWLHGIPLYALFLIDAANGALSIWSGAPFTPVALVLKALVALYLCLVVEWTAEMTVQTLLVLLCCVAYLVLMPRNAASTIFIAKTAAVLLLCHVVPPYLRQLADHALARFLRTVLWCIALSLALGLAGIGHDRYGDDEAVLLANGFFAAGNELNLALVGLFWWLSSRRAEGWRETIDTPLYVLCLVLMVLSSSKTTLLGAAITLLYFSRRRVGSMLIALGLVAVVALVLTQTPIWARWTFFFDAYAGEGTLSALTAGRLTRPLQLFESWSEIPWTGLALLAVGYGYIESDPLDLIMNFGLIGALLFGLFARALYLARGPSWVPWVLVLGISVLAGHVVYSVFAMPILLAALHASTRSAGVSEIDERPSSRQAEP